MYNSKRLIPAPFVNFNKVYDRTADQTQVGSTFRISVQGTIVAYMGSPDSTGVLWDQTGFPPDETIAEDSRLASIIRKQEAIRELFSQDGYTFEVQSADGSQPMKCNPRVIDVNFPEGLWNVVCPYTITLEADIVYVNGQALGEDGFTEYISDAQESWSFETDETPEGIGLPRTYRLTHSISATGKRFYDETGTLESPAWIQARDYVLPRLGFNSSIALSSGVNNLPTYYGGYNHSRTSQQDELAGNFSVTETWVIASGQAIEEFECSIKTDAGVGLTSVSINGNITGLEQRDSSLNLTTSKYANANTKFTQVQSSLLTRAQAYAGAGIALNIVPVSTLIGRNEINGNIGYSYEYDNRPSNIFSGVTMENISISEQFPADIFAAIPVIGRAAGPVLQSLGTYSERVFSLNLELAVDPPVYGVTTSADIRVGLFQNPRITQPAAFDLLYQAARPSIAYATTYEFIRNKQENWEPKTGRYSFNVEFVFGS